MQPANQDESNLKLLATLHYVWAALQALTGLIGVVFIGAGAFLSAMPQLAQNSDIPPEWFGAIFAGLGILVFVMIESSALLAFFVGRNIARRRRHTYCMVMSGLDCLSIPLGTALGLFTILTLQRPSVRQMFAGPPAPPPNAHFQANRPV